MAVILVVNIFDLSSLMEKDSSVKLQGDICQIKAEYKVRGRRGSERGFGGSVHGNKKRRS